MFRLPLLNLLTVSHLGTERTPSGEDEAERGNSCPETEGKSHNLVLFKLNKKSSKRRCLNVRGNTDPTKNSQ